MSWAGVICAAALAGEASALRALAGEGLLAAAAWHLAACLWVVVVAGIGTGGRRERVYRQLVAAALVACLPGVGVVGVVFVVLPMWRRGPRAEVAPIVECEPAELRDASRESAALAELLLDSRARPLEQSARRLRALRCLPLSVALPHWRAALRQPSEELRLLAHALIAQHEKQRQDRMERARVSLTRATAPAERWPLLRTLAFAHWELVCGERMPSEATEHAQAAAREHAQAALAIQPEAQLCLLMVRLCLRRLDGAGAAHWLQRAACLGVSSASRARLHAEAAFLQRRFAQIPHWLRQVRDDELCARVKVFWSREARNWRPGDPSSEQ